MPMSSTTGDDAPAVDMPLLVRIAHHAFELPVVNVRLNGPHPDSQYLSSLDVVDSRQKHSSPCLLRFFIE